VLLVPHILDAELLWMPFIDDGEPAQTHASQ
jgi:hypothetical protein